MNSKIKMSVGVGASSLIMIFVVLTAVTLAALALGTASADYKLAQKSAQHTTLFYAADSKAEQTLARIDEVLTMSKKDTWQKEISQIPELKVIEEKNRLYITYEAAVNDRQTLKMLVATREKDAHQSPYYKVFFLKIQNNKAWDYEEEGLGFEEVVIGE